MHFIDWAADPHALGAGVRLLRRVAGLVQMTCAVGGSAATRKILPLLGFHSANDAITLARPVRPVRQVLTHQYRNWKLPLRLVRNMWWSLVSPSHPPSGWSCEKTLPQMIPESLWHNSTPGPLTRRRSPAQVAYFLSCPIARFELFLAKLDGEPRACFLLSFVPGQVRITDLWLTPETAEHYDEVYALAVKAAIADPSVAEVTARASTEVRIKALRRCGFRVVRRQPIMVRPLTMVPPEGLDCQFIDNDAAFLNAGAPAYLT